jgi:uncharacterized glyoxalase superfamily protein PhnB
MSDLAGSSTPQAECYPSLYYEDAEAALTWFERVLGFRRRLVVPGPSGTVRHAEIEFRGAVLFLGSARPEEGLRGPGRCDAASAGVSLRVHDPDAAYARAAAAGAEIVRPLRDEDYGARGFMVRDPEGRTFYVADYRPGAHWTT